MSFKVEEGLGEKKHWEMLSNNKQHANWRVGIGECQLRTEEERQTEKGLWYRPGRKVETADREYGFGAGR